MLIPATSSFTEDTEIISVTIPPLYHDQNFTRALLHDVIPELKEQRWQLLSSQVTEAQNHRQKQLVSCQISYRHTAETCTRTANLIIKFYGERGGDIAYNALQQLQLARFKSPSRYRVPHPYGYGQEPTILVQEKVGGQQWIRLLLDPHSDSHEAADRAATWLIRLQQSSLIMQATETEESRTAKLHTQIHALTTTFPSFAPRITTIGQLLQQQHASLGNAPLVPSHGDYHAGNVLLTPTTTTVIDFDAFGPRDAAFDVGYCIAQLLSMSYFRTGSLTPGAKAAARFWLAYNRQGGQARWPNVVKHVTATFVQILHYTLCAMQAERSDILPWWLAMIEQWLNSQHPSILDHFANGRSQDALCHCCN